MNTEFLWLVIGMAAVTFIPRAIPAVLMDKLKFGKRVEHFMRLIPYTAMTALIFPGVIAIDATRPYIGLTGGAVAAVLAWLKVPVMFCVLATIAVDMLLYIVI